MGTSNYTKWIGNLELYKEEILGLIYKWDESNSVLELHEYLGLNWIEYYHLFSLFKLD